MRHKSDTRAAGAARATGTDGWQRIRADLESRGLSPERAAAVAERLAPTLSRLSRDEVAAVLDGIGAACGEPGAPPGTSREIEEIQRLMRGFASELRKLEEGLRILSAYALRMRSRASQDGGTLH